VNQLAVTPAVFLRALDAARGNVARLSTLLADAERLAETPDDRFPRFYAFLGQLTRAPNGDAIDALMAGPGQALIAALDAEFCQGCFYFQDGGCAIARVPSIDGCC